MKQSTLDVSQTITEDTDGAGARIRVFNEKEQRIARSFERCKAFPIAIRDDSKLCLDHLDSFPVNLPLHYLISFVA
jgi:hypothetical protein